MASDPKVARKEMEGLLRGGRLTTFDPSWFRYGDEVFPMSIIPTYIIAKLKTGPV